MSEFNFISANEAYRALYYQLPKVLFTSPTYKDMKNDSKIAYAMLQDRCETSIKNNWIDENNHIYFIFTRQELMDILGCKENKISAIKKELKAKNLLFEKRTPPKKMPDGTWRNSPNRLYLGKLEVTAQDVYSLNQPDGYSKEFESGKNQLSKEISKTKGFTESGEKPLSKETPSNQRLFESGEKGDNLDKLNSLDTKRHLKDTESDRLQDQLLLDNFVDLMKDDSVATFIPEKVLHLIKLFSVNYTEAQKTVKTIHNAKHKAEEQTGETIVFEELSAYGINGDQALYTTLLKAYQKQKTEKIENMQNLIFIYVKNWFIENPIAAKHQAETKKTVPQVSIENWVDR